MDDKTKSLVAHIPLFGLLIAFFMNQSEKGATTSFFLRQILGMSVFGLLAWLLATASLSLLSLFISIIILILWTLSLIYALKGQQKLIPIVGEMFQQWFKSIS